MIVAVGSVSPFGAMENPATSVLRPSLRVHTYIYIYIQREREREREIHR
jgi:hypothetical protein